MIRCLCVYLSRFSFGVPIPERRPNTGVADAALHDATRLQSSVGQRAGNTRRDVNCFIPTKATCPVLNLCESFYTALCKNNTS